MPILPLIAAYPIDFTLFGLAAALLIGYHLRLAYVTAHRPHRTLQGAQISSRHRWLEMVIGKMDQTKLVIDTLRNIITAATFLASTSVLLIMGILSFTSQLAQNELFHLKSADTLHLQMLLTKVALLLMCFFGAFFSFTSAIRLYNHLNYMITTPATDLPQEESFRLTNSMLDKASHFYSLGMRAYYFAIPLVFWLIGPWFMLISCAGLIVFLYQIDFSPSHTRVSPFGFMR